MNIGSFYYRRLLSRRQWTLLSAGVGISVAALVYSLISITDYEQSIVLAITNAKPHIRIFFHELPVDQFALTSKSISSLLAIRCCTIAYRIPGPISITVRNADTGQNMYSEAINSEVVGYCFKPGHAIPIDLHTVYSKACRTRGEMDPLAIMQDYSTRHRVIIDEDMLDKILPMAMPSGDNFMMTISDLSGNSNTIAVTTAGSYLVPPIGVMGVEQHSVYVRIEDIQPHDQSGKPLANCLDIQLNNPTLDRRVRDQLRKLLPPNTRIEIWSERDQDSIAFIDTLRTACLWGAAILISLSGICVYYVLSMVIEDKRKQIAILMAHGASDASIRYILLRCGCIIAALGSMAGVLCGATAAYVFHDSQQRLMRSFYYSESAVHIPCGGVVVIVSLAFISCIIGVWLPCRSALKIQPAILIRSE